MSEKDRRQLLHYEDSPGHPNESSRRQISGRDKRQEQIKKHMYVAKSKLKAEMKYNKLSDRIAAKYSPNAQKLTLKSLPFHRGFHTIVLPSSQHGEEINDKTAFHALRLGEQKNIFHSNSKSPNRFITTSAGMNRSIKRPHFDPNNWKPESADIDPFGSSIEREDASQFTLEPQVLGSTSQNDQQLQLKADVMLHVEKCVQNETKIQQKSDSKSRRKAIKRVLKKVPEPRSEAQKTILSKMLNVIAEDYRVASSYAAIKYTRIQAREILPSISVLRQKVDRELAISMREKFLLEKQIKSQYKTKEWLVIRKTGIKAKFVQHVQKKLRDVLCINEPLMLRLEKLWHTKMQPFDDVLSNTIFCKSMPMPANLFRDHIYQTAGIARTNLLKYWIPKAIVMIIKSACTYVEVVEKEMKRVKVNEKTMGRLDTMNNRDTLNKTNGGHKSLKGKSRVFTIQAIIADPTLLTRTDLDNNISSIRQRIKRALVDAETNVDKIKFADAQEKGIFHSQIITETESTIISMVQDKKLLKLCFKKHGVPSLEAAIARCHHLLESAGTLLSRQLRDAAEQSLKNVSLFFSNLVTRNNEVLYNMIIDRDFHFVQVTRKDILLAALHHYKCPNGIGKRYRNNFLVYMKRRSLPECLSVVSVSLHIKEAVSGPQPSLNPSLRSITKHLTQSISDIADAAQGFPVIEVDLSGNRINKHRQDLQRRGVCDIESNHPNVIKCQDTIQTALNCHWQTCRAIVWYYQKFMYVFDEAEETRLNTIVTEVLASRNSADKMLDDVSTDFEKQLFAFSDIEFNIGRALNKIHRETNRLNRIKKQIQNITPKTVYLPVFAVKTEKIKFALIQRLETLRNEFLNNIMQICREQMREICDEYEEIARRFMITPKDADELLELEAYGRTSKERLQILRSRVGVEIGKQLKALINCDYKFIVADIVRAGSCTYWPKKILYFVKKHDQILNGQKVEQRKLLGNRMSVFEKNITTLEYDIKSLSRNSSLNMDHIKAILEKMAKMRKLLVTYTEESETINDLETVLHKGGEATDYSERLKLLDSSITPYEKLWTGVHQFKEVVRTWRTAPLRDVNPDHVETETEQLRKLFVKSQRQFRASLIAEPLKVAQAISEEIAAFLNKEVPLIATVCTPGLRSRHWDEIQSLLNKTIIVTDTTNIQDLVKLKLHESVEKIEDICQNASKEFAVEKLLDRMLEEWNGVLFETKEHKDTQTYILKSVDDIETMVDDQVTKTDTMRASPYSKPFLTRLNAWESKLQYLVELLENWLSVQQVWMYLEPIFSSADICRQMPIEAARFESVDATWRKLMQFCVESPAVLGFADHIDFLAELKQANGMVEVIQKGLNQYLEKKRLFFPRFFFLSNDEMLEILSETKDPLRVQPHLKKCFEGIKSLIFQESLDITGMKSVEGEEITFPYPDIDEASTINPQTTGGQVEIWLKDVERIMRKTVASCIDDGYKAYDARERTKWILNWPGQIVLCVTQLVLTYDVTCAVNEYGSKGLRDVASRCTSQIEAIVRLVRGKLTKLQRKTISPLVVLDVHSRDVLLDLVRNKVDNIKDFGWQSQLRYYYNDEGNSAKTAEAGSIEAKIINALRLYGNEYLGNSGRLVITPLTDRCYRTLMGAVHLNFGGAPEGPAGTGKTETVKDLGKAVAVQCVVYNCSDSLDFQAMGKFFKGLAGTGAWSCFDEFNRIELEVLSVVAQQILTIQRAKIIGKKSFDFEGTWIQLNVGCNVFITMNPGYAGRQELPDNLKALFRTVAMMVPNYAQIAQIILYSMGYMDAAILAQKIVATYTLCSEQLSKQRHYDYGMRAVMAVLRAASAAKRKEPDTDESVLILRTICDVNVPKFLSHDLPLFRGIIRDLFPGVEVVAKERNDMMSELKAVCARNNLQSKDSFLNKIVEIYDMLLVRHGFMVVGLPFAGKTSALEVLKKTLGSLSKIFPDRHDMKWNETHTVKINPKALTLNNLYGSFDEQTHEWSDGVLAVKYRACSTTNENYAIGKQTDLKWVVFDGPVDAIWIENMNTVLDDNRKLCLMSGEMLSMSDTMSMIFEPMDLEVASPATVSRCGMIYMEPDAVIGYESLVLSWIQKIKSPSSISFKNKSNDEDICIGPLLPHDDDGDHLLQLFQWLGMPSIIYVEKHLHAQARVEPLQLTANILKLMESTIAEYLLAMADQRNAKVSDFTNDITETTLEAMFLDALICAVGSIVQNNDHAGFSEFVRDISASKTALEKKYGVVYRGLLLMDWTAPKFYAPRKTFRTLRVPLPSAGNLQDYSYSMQTRRWVRWENTLKDCSIPSDMLFENIFIPTTSTVKCKSLLQRLVKRGFPTLLCGPTGTGKSALLKKMILDDLDQKNTLPVLVNFSAQTQVTQVQDIIDSKLDKLRRGVYGPRGGKQCIIFIDEFNLPEVEEYGAQPPLELIRQFLCDGGWFDLATKDFKNIVRTQIITAMGPPSGGRNSISPRVMRHFSFVCMTENDTPSLERIFRHIMHWNLNVKYTFSDEVCTMTNSVVDATLSVYNEIRKKLKPTPLKSHYTFNLRDVSRVTQGVHLARPSASFTRFSLIRLWVHETLRVFHDRLVNNDDRVWLVNAIRMLVSNEFNVKFDEVFQRFAKKNGNDEESIGLLGNPATEITYEDLSQFYFSDIMNSISPNGGRSYLELDQKFEDISKKIEEYVDEYDNAHTGSGLIIFEYAVEHLLRASRILKMPGGHAILVGVGGNGRKSLSRLAAFIAEFTCFEITVGKGYGRREWQDDLRHVIRESGGGDSPLLFLFNDSQINDEAMVEDINSLLNTGEVPNLLLPEEIAEFAEVARKFAKEDMGKKVVADMTITDLYAYFVSRVKSRMHIMFACSPLNAMFRERLRKFPSLINCCTIDWYDLWPSQALAVVAKRLLVENGKKTLFSSAEIHEDVIEVCQHFHKSASTMSQKYKDFTGRHTYVTPTSFLTLLKTYKNCLHESRKTNQDSQDRYANGLKQLELANMAVTKMQMNLENLKPILKQSQEDTQKLLEEIQAKVPGVKKLEASVQQESDIAQKEADEVSEKKAECEADLAEAIPLLQDAINALNTLKKADIDSVKSYTSPPVLVKLVMEAVCVMLSKRPDRIPDPNDNSKRIEDYWGPSKKLLGESSFLQSLKDYDKDRIPSNIIKKIRDRFLSNDDFKPGKMKKVSKAATGLCKWVVAMEAYDRVAKIVAPKKELLKEAEAVLATKLLALEKKQNALNEVQTELRLIEEKHDAAKTEKENLAEKVNQCNIQLRRAKQLIDSLGGEKSRWSNLVSKLASEHSKITGDILLASSSIAYLGAYTSKFRNQLQKEWMSIVGTTRIPLSQSASLISSLGNPVLIKKWTSEQLPSDNFSVENGIMMSKTDAWPLLIDPQGQANKWIKNSSDTRKLVVVKNSDTAAMVRGLEQAIQFGYRFLLEDIGQDIDPFLDPVLERQIYRKGGTTMIRLGDNTIEYDTQFAFYLTTKIANPHYLPEVSAKVLLLNFMITPIGLEGQLLNQVVIYEKPDLEKMKNDLISEGAENSAKLQNIENEILHILSSSSGNLLEDEAAVNALKQAKLVADDVKKKQLIALETEKKIDATRMEYQNVAFHAQVLFFAVNMMSKIEPVYQYSLEWFKGLFRLSLEKSDKHNDISRRAVNIKDHFQYSLYQNVNRSLLEKDKLLFSFLLCTELMNSENKIDKQLIPFFLTSGINVTPVAVDDAYRSFLTERSLSAILRLASFPPFKGLENTFALGSSCTSTWTKLCASESPDSVQFPLEWRERLTQFQKLLVFRCLRPDKLLSATKTFISTEMGSKYVHPPPFNLKSCYDDSSCSTPLIFILSPGSDPMTIIIKFAEEHRKRINSVSLGQGQGPVAERLIENGKRDGSWVALQNCHLAPSWMSNFERLCEIEQFTKCNASFRLFCTSYPTEIFPISVLQNSVKITNEVPKGIRANLLRSYTSDPISDISFFESLKGKKHDDFCRLLFGLCMFHAVVQERVLYGPLGWNVPYEFNQSDLSISARQLQMFLSEQDDVPFKALLYTVGECNYGGRVTDDNDRETLRCILQRFYNSDVLIGGHEFIEDTVYKVPPYTMKNEFINFINEFPSGDDIPEMLGFHKNASFSKNQKEASKWCDSVLKTISSGTSSGLKSDSESTLKNMSDKILKRLPSDFDIEEVRVKFPVSRVQSMNTVLLQEIGRFNRLTCLIRNSLFSVQRALRGEELMSTSLENLCREIGFGKLPTLWLRASYPSLKPLASYVDDLILRLNFFKTWVAEGIPHVYWISGFFFTQAFLTGTKQNHAREHTIPIDNLCFNFEMMSRAPIKKKPLYGAYISGLFIEAATWNYEKQILVENGEGVLTNLAPTIWLKPTTNDKEAHFPYNCPVYKTSDRRGELSTTGHSTNFIMKIRIPTEKSQAHWKQRGAAMLTQLDD